MALIRCPECGQNVSDKAKHCIHCGYPLQEPIDEFTHKWRCVNCGEMTHSLICSHCGKSSTEKQFKVNIPQDAIGDVVTSDSHMEQTPITNNKDSKEQAQIQDSKAKMLWVVLGIIAAIVIILPFVLQGGSNGSKSGNRESTTLDPNRTREPCADGEVVRVFDSTHSGSEICYPDYDGYYHISFGHHHHK